MNNKTNKSVKATEKEINLFWKDFLGDDEVRKWWESLDSNTQRGITQFTVMTQQVGRNPYTK